MRKKNRALIEELRFDVDELKGHASSYDAETAAFLASMPKPIIEVEEQVHYLAQAKVEIDTDTAQATPGDDRIITVKVSGEYDAPTGEVHLYDNGTASRASRRLVDGKAEFKVTFPLRSRHTFTARYGGDLIYESQSESNSVLVVVM